MSSVTSKEVAAAVIDFIRKSVSQGEISEDFVESMDVAVDCIADGFGIDKDNDAVIRERFNGQGLVEMLNSRTSAAPKQDAVPVHVSDSGADKQKAESLKLEGNRLMKSGNLQGAIDKYTEAIEADCENAVYLSNRAAAYSALRNHQAAVSDAEKAIAIDPNYSKAYSRVGLARFALGDPKAAMEAYQKGMEIEGDKVTDAMKNGFERSRERYLDQLNTNLGDSGTSQAPASRETSSQPQGGMPDLSSLGNMFGGGGGGLSDMFNNPQIMQAAQQMMQNPEALQGLMQNPQLRQMASSLGLGGQSAGTSANDESGDSESSQPNLSDLMNNPMLQNLANQFMGGNRPPQ